MDRTVARSAAVAFAVALALALGTVSVARSAAVAFAVALGRPERRDLVQEGRGLLRRP